MYRFRQLWKFSTLQFHKGASEYQNVSENVVLRGVTIKGRYNDLPNLLFFTEACDPVENWIPFFSDPNNKILDYRNVHILSPRNFGTSDKHYSFDVQDLANDVVRYMYYNKITMATLSGHGFGAKVALAAGCYHPERTTGVFCIDYSPMDQRYHEAFTEFRGYIAKLSQINTKELTKSQIESYLKENIDCPKWRLIFSDNLIKLSSGQWDWKFALKFLHNNVSFNKADSIAFWPVKAGLYTGRAHFAFPEFSRWVHLGTNTLPMLKVCPQVRGFGHDVHSVQGDNNTLNHWIYEFNNQSFVFASRFTKFLSMYDGVHLLLKDRTEVGKEFVPSIIYSKKDPNHIYSDYSPAHYYHNWRFNNVYKNLDTQNK
ncbi:unnamed protein product [Paramecium pentaurelia]|uniref:AB hydrolase-1 domain-containing protein n=1 Tax=Paramecium pentaurelia TaxID=43138 RepID=A0A8S1RWP5_9CILI|nr:unnamed protein product [Paramecium pentaurelia]